MQHRGMWVAVVVAALLGWWAPNALADDANLTVLKDGTGSGTVVSNPAKINCGTLCSGTYPIGQGAESVVDLTATPASGSRFVRWSGAGSGCGGVTLTRCLFQIMGNVTLTATFNQTRTLTITKTGTGTGSVTSDPTGISCGATCSAEEDLNSVVTLTATPSATSRFAGWSGGGCSGSGSCQVTMDQAKSVSAQFTLQVSLTLQVDTFLSTATGKVVSSPAGIDCDGFCTKGFDQGADVTLTAVHDPNVLVNWPSECTIVSGDTCTLTMSAQRLVTVQFFSVRTLTVVKAGAGQGSVAASGAIVTLQSAFDCGTTCSAPFATGATVSLSTPGCLTGVCVSATPAAGSAFVGWSGIGCSALPVSTCNFPLTGDATITATFAAQHTLTVTKAGSGSGTVSAPGLSCGNTCSAGYNDGTAVTLTAAPDARSRFVGWSGGGCSGTDPCTVTIDAARSVTATFNAAARLTVVNVGTGTGRFVSDPAGIDCPGTCSALFDKGTTVKLVTYPDPGSGIVGYPTDIFNWCAEGTTNTSPTCTQTLDFDMTRNVNLAPTHNVTVTMGGTGSGAVISIFPDDTIQCGTVCSIAIPEGGFLSLMAGAYEGSTFTGYGGACASATGAVCELYPDSDASVVANFARNPTPTPTPTPTATATASPPPTPQVSSSTAPPATTPAAKHQSIDTKLVKAKVSRRKRTASFRFTGVGASRFRCALAKKGKAAKFKPCKSPVTFKKLRRGRYVFQVRAVGDTTPARKTFAI